MSLMKTYAQGSLMVAALIAINALVHLYAAHFGMFGMVTSTFEVLWLVISVVALLSSTRFSLNTVAPLVYVIFNIVSLLLTVGMMLSLGRDNAFLWLVRLREHPAPVHYFAIGFAVVWSALNMAILVKPTPAPANPAAPDGAPEAEAH